MNIQIVAVGTKMPKWVDDGVNEYLRRFPADFNVQFTEIAAAKRGKSINAQSVIEQEGKKCLAAIPRGNRIIALEVKGNSWNSPQLAKQIEKWQMDGRNVSILIGGPEGLSKECKDAAEQWWSLSSLTLPHPMVRVICAEALYRAWSITQNHPYHRE